LAKKRVKTELKRSPTKRQLTRWQRQQRIQRIIVVVGAVFFILIGSFIGYGYYAEQYKPLHQPVVKINGTAFDMDYYIKLLELYTQGEDAAVTSDMADNLIDVIGYGDAIRRASPGLGFAVSADEVKNELKNTGLPDEKVYRDVITSTLLAGKVFQNYFDPKVPNECEQVQVQALFVESEDVAKIVADKLREGDDFSSLAEEYSLETMTKDIGGDLGWLPKDFIDMFLGDLRDSLLKDIPFDLEPGMLSKPIYDETVTKEIGYWIMEAIEKDEQKGSHARGILLGSRHEAEEVRAMIEAGEDFGSLAKEYSQDPMSREQGGDLGWIKQDSSEGGTVRWLALQLEPGTLSQPAADSSAKTKGGYWLVRVLDRDDNRALDNEIRDVLKGELFDEWVNEHRQKDVVETYLTEKQKAWAVARIIEDRGQ